MRWISTEALRSVERAAILERQVPSYLLMCRAGAAVARRVARIARLRGTRSIVILTGGGNNGGDGCVAAKCLFEDGFDVRVLMTCVPAHLKADAHKAWEDMHAAGVGHQVLATEEGWEAEAWYDPDVYPREGVIVDALLGIGLSGAPSGVVLRAIRWINAVRVRCPVVAVDVPSGLSGDSAAVPGEAVAADYTVTFTRPKKSFALPALRAYLGHVRVEDIGIPNDLTDAQECDVHDNLLMIAYPDVRPFLLRRRALDSHKGSYGHVLVIGGCAHYPHAPVLAGVSAFRVGAGIVTLCVPALSFPAAAVHLPEAILHERREDEDLPPALMAEIQNGRYSVVAIGPGMGRSDKAREILEALLTQTRVRMVVDADALHALAGLVGQGMEPDRTELRCVLTPHPGEAAALLGTDSATVQADRVSAVRAIADEYHAVTVLKGSGSLTAAPGGSIQICLAGNPGMATAGSGDVLTGAIAGCMAKGLGVEDAAQLGVWLHASAGDDAAIAVGQEAITATTIADMIGGV